MSLAVVYSRANAGINALPVIVEIHISPGLPSFSIVGLPETAVKESKDRVRSALINSKFEFPAKRITVNLAPADLPKDGGRFDLPIALGILAASGQIPTEKLSEFEFAGELALTGALRPIQGALPFAIACNRQQRNFILPQENADEATLSQDARVFPASNLFAVCEHLQGRSILPSYIRATFINEVNYSCDIADVRGQLHAKRALEIAAAGGHSLLMCGPPGAGKTMLASRLATLLPELTETEALEVAAIHSISHQKFDYKTWRQRPFRSPHHTASSVALVGGGSPPKPGEISLAHHGILFLDELPEFQRHVLDALRQPLESGHVVIARAGYQTQFPAQFQLIAAMNPCPCGMFNDQSGRCRCTGEQIQRYQSRLSGPLLDRIDMHVQVTGVPLTDFSVLPATETSATVKARVIQARTKQWQRAEKFNAILSPQELTMHCHLDDATMIFLNQSITKLGISARSYHRILKIARTIADLADCEIISIDHLAEALSYRRKIETS